MGNKHFSNLNGTVSLMRMKGMFQVTAAVGEDVHVYKTTNREQAVAEFQRIQEKLGVDDDSGSSDVLGTKHLS